MKAVVKTQPGVGHVELMDVPAPSVTKGQVIIEIKAAGICGTDLHIYNDEYKSQPPVILGHEISGEVVEVGHEVTRIKMGDRVTINPTAGRLCGQCRYCKIGAYFFCVNRASHGSIIDGGFATYCCVREEIAHQLPEHFDYDVGSLCEPLACAYQAMVELTEILPEDFVVVSGPGPIGLLCMLLAKTRGARVVMLGTSADAKRVEQARQLGADGVLNVEREDPRAVIADLTEGEGADVVVECAGVAASVNQCLQLVKKMGRYTQVGLFEGPVTVDFQQVVLKQLQIQGAISATWQTWQRVMNFLEQSTIDFRPVIWPKLPLSRWEDGFTQARNKEAIKVLLYPEA